MRDRAIVLVGDGFTDVVSAGGASEPPPPKEFAEAGRGDDAWREVVEDATRKDWLIPVDSPKDVDEEVRFGIVGSVFGNGIQWKETSPWTIAFTVSLK